MDDAALYIFISPIRFCYSIQIQNLFNDITQKLINIDLKWKNGYISDVENYQSKIIYWHEVSETLKNRIIDFYQNVDPVNNLNIMAFSGARGNISQIKQLVGLRGLMSNQKGDIIDIPITTNFREGLSTVDYLVSSYGARKGIVDTALKTADSGYLTRRLIYLAQELIIRDLDCKTKDGLIYILNYKYTIYFNLSIKWFNLSKMLWLEFINQNNYFFRRNDRYFGCTINR